jgi:hypothetical protein
MVIQYEKTFQGAHKFYTTVENEYVEYLFTKQYFGYNKRQALQLFKTEVKEAQTRKRALS